MHSLAEQVRRQSTSTVQPGSKELQSATYVGSEVREDQKSPRPTGRVYNSQSRSLDYLAAKCWRVHLSFVRCQRLVKSETLHHSYARIRCQFSLDQ